MISLRSYVLRGVFAAVTFALAACADGTVSPVVNGLSADGAGGAARMSSSAAPKANIDARVIVTKAGDAYLEVRTGTYDPATNSSSPDGQIQSLSYKVYNTSNKVVLTKSVNFSHSTSSYLTQINFCSSSNDDDDDDDNSHNSSSSCSVHWGTGYRVSVTAGLRNIGGGSSSGSVTEDAVNGYLPDIDLTHSVITVAGTTNPVSSVLANTPTTYSVDVPNMAVINGVQTTYYASLSCLVTVDGLPQLPLPNGVYSKWTNPNAYGFLGDPLVTIPARGHSPCQFTLTLPAGTHKIVVTAIVLSPGDYDLSNNSTATYTVTAGSTPTDITPGMLQIDLGAGAGVQNLDPAPTGGAPTILSGKPVTLYQVVALAAGSAPGAVKCVATITPKPSGTPVTVTATATLTTSPGVSCAIPYTFPAGGDYTYAVTVSLGSGAADGVPSNDVRAPATIHVTASVKTAVATVGAIKFRDPAVSASANFVTLPADTVIKVGDAVTYSADVTLGSLSGASTTSVTCNAMVDDIIVTNGVTWVSAQTFSNVAPGSTVTCQFKYTIADNGTVSAAGTSHTVGVAVTLPSDVLNGAPAGPALNAAKNTALVYTSKRLDIAAGAIQYIGTTTSNLSDVTVKQGMTNITLRVPVTGGPSVVVSCGNLLVNQVTPTTGAIPAADTLARALSQTVTSATVTLTATGTGTCEYKISMPAQLGLGSIPLIAQITAASASAGLDPLPLNNYATGTLTVVSNGSFSVLPDPHTFNIVQDWTIPGTVTVVNGALTAASGGRLDHQQVQVTRLALLVVPTQATLGLFGMSASVVSGVGGATSFGTGTAPLQVLGQSDGLNAHCNQTGPISGIVSGAPQVAFTANICAEPSQFAGYQVITVTYNLTSGATPAAQLPPLFATSISVRVNLDFNLNPGATTANDHVSALITIPVTSSIAGCRFDDLLGASSCNSSFGLPTIVSPAP